MAEADQRRTLPLVRLEAAMVLSTLLGVEPAQANSAISALFAECDVEVVPVTDSLAVAAVTAFARYGKGRGHPARLNFADCLVYAAAKQADAPLLFVGRDFILTDIASVLDDLSPTVG
jgi:ribonuclease VapC